MCAKPLPAYRIGTSKHASFREHALTLEETRVTLQDPNQIINVFDSDFRQRSLRYARAAHLIMIHFETASVGVLILFETVGVLYSSQQRKVLNTSTVLYRIHISTVFY